MKAQIQPGQIVGNRLSNGTVVTCRVIGWIEAVGMWRLTDARETRSDAWLVEHNRTWAAPIENIVEVPGPMMHRRGLVILGEG